MSRNVLEFFEKGAMQAAPGELAVIDGKRGLTFAELASQAKSCASRIMEATDAFNRPVAVFLPKAAETIIVDLGIVYSGNAFCNLDVKSPAQRIRNILDKIDPVLIVTSRELVGLLGDIGETGERIILVEALLSDGISDERAIGERLRRIVDTDPLCIINTSGSTGTPKGVALSHRGTIDFMEWVLDTFEFDASDRIGCLSPLYFDIYLLELFVCLSRGATLLLIPEHAAIFPARLLDFLEKSRVTFLFWVPSIMVAIANLALLGKYDLSTLRNVFFAGEVFPTRQLNQWRKALPGTRFVNLYGPIEIHVDCTYFIVDRDFGDDEPLPIGSPCRNTDILILDEHGRSCAPGQHGELCVRGTSLALGYWNDPEKTAKAFVQNPLNTHYPELIYRTGDIAYLDDRNEIRLVGRRDFQIKHMGYRINLQEIEHQIHCIEGIGQACVLYNEPLKEITAFYEVISKNVAAVDIRAHLFSIFPKYMVPTVLECLDALPRNPNGKVDRNGLRGRLRDSR
jgi:amino acid adenylation domain-containing protein